MTRFFSTLRGRLIVSHLAAVFVGVLAIVFTAGPLTQRFFVNHVSGMGLSDDMMGDSTGSMMGQLETSLTDSLWSALIVALVVSAVTAVVASIIAAQRIAQPVERMSNAARRLARGQYSERVPVPREVELATLAEDINTLAQSLETTEARRLQLINEVAHELRTPLTTIEGYMEGLLDGVFEPTEEVFGATAREAARLKRLAADLSLLSRAEEGALELQTKQLDLGEVAVEAADGLRPLFLEKDITFTVDGDGRLPVTANADRLTQVFTNILGNAITYTEQGGRVVLTILRDGASATVTVTDNGKGLTQDDLARVFDRFHRVDPSLPGGTGIGLTVARSLVRRHGGDITAHSRGPGTGSRFVVSIPLSR
ncbi:MAG: ATP-binding protein [Acidimicrobiia bacterium]|nr:MAG: ATP-binding protein [Acidimicrobiia bacterium]